MKNKIQEELDDFIAELKADNEDDEYEFNEWEQGYIRGLEIALSHCNDKEYDLLQRKAKAYDSIKETYADYNPDYKIIYK